MEISSIFVAFLENMKLGDLIELLYSCKEKSTLKDSYPHYGNTGCGVFKRGVQN
jgi:hypothetical protein